MLCERVVKGGRRKYKNQKLTGSRQMSFFFFFFFLLLRFCSRPQPRSQHRSSSDLPGFAGKSWKGDSDSRQLHFPF